MPSIKPIRDITNTAATPSGDEWILIDNGIDMSKAKIDDAVAPKATEIVEGKIADLNLGTAATANVEDFATAAQGSKADTAVQPSDLATVATTGDYADLTNKPTLGTVASHDVEEFATAEQGEKADSAVQPEDLAAVATTGSYNDLLNKPTLGTAAAADTSDFATATQGAKADTAVQSVNSKTGTSITLTASDVGAAASSHTHPDATTSSAGFMSATDKQKLDGIEAGAQVNSVTSVAGKTGAVTLTASDVGAAPDTIATALAGGTAGQVLIKESNADHDFTWVNVPGGGDMLASVYDPTGVAADAFHMDYMREGTDAKVMTANERQKVSSVVYQPAVEPALDFVMSDQAAFLPEWFTRASGGTYFGPDGTIKTASANEPRIEYDPATGELLGLLIEEQRTNLLLYSEDLSQSVWLKANSSLGSSIMIRGMKLVPLIENTASARHFVHQSYSTTDDGTRYWCGSAVLKKYDAGSVRYPIIYVAWGGDPQSGTRAGIMVDWDSETTYPFATGTATLIASGLEPLGDGLYRAWACVQLGSEQTGVRLVVGIRDSVGSGTLPTTHAGDGVSGICLGMLQLEEGKYPTSYIPTGGAAVTRAPDFLPVPVSEFPFDRRHGTIFADFRSYRPASAYTGQEDERAAVWTISDNASGTGDNLLDLFYTNQLGLLGRNGGSDTTVNMGSQPDPVAFEKVAVAFDGQNARVSRNGASVTGHNVPFGLASAAVMRVGNTGVSIGGARVLKGHMRRITYYPSFLPDADLKALTA